MEFSTKEAIPSYTATDDAFLHAKTSAVAAHPTKDEIEKVVMRKPKHVKKDTYELTSDWAIDDTFRPEEINDSKNNQSDCNSAKQSNETVLVVSSENNNP